MTPRSVAAAQLPPVGLAGLDPAWSRLVTAVDHRGDERTWHVLDSAVGADPGGFELTVLAVHGNPTWSYLWRDLMARAPQGVRVVAVDQLDMGFSERTGIRRRLADRVDDLGGLTAALDLDGPVVTVAHDWGGPVSLGWALAHRDQLAGVVLTNTAVHQPAGSPAPGLIRTARLPGVLRRVTVDTTTFIRGALAMSRPRPTSEVAEGYLAPYGSRDRREAIAGFVEDIPLDAAHPSAATLDAIAEGLDALASVPVLLGWGPEDKVFSDLYLHDLEARLPHADVHRFVGAAHMVPEDADVAGLVWAWVGSLDDRAGVASPAPERRHRPPLWAALDRGDDGDRPAVVELAAGDATTITFAALHRRVEHVAAGLVDAGVEPGDRVALLVPPGIDLTVVLYACWRMGAVMVLVDSGLGPRNMSRALASAAPDHLIAITRGLLAAQALRWPGRRIAVDDLTPARRRLLGVVTTVSELEARGRGAAAAAPPGDDDLAAIVFTSGSTGPSKGVAYRHHQLQAQRDLIAELYRIGPDDRLVAAFAPFALFGPALGIASAVPDMDVTQPGTLTAAALGDAATAIEPTMVFASPAALVNVVATADGLTPEHRRALGDVRLLLSAGAPVNPALLRQASEAIQAAEAHTPYGMTEMLPVADISLAALGSTPATTHRRDAGVRVGRPAPGVAMAISAIDHDGVAVGEPSDAPGVAGEVLVSAPHRKAFYDRLWYTEHASSHPDGWHRTGDVGMLDDDGVLWIGGRLAHVITAADGPVLPVSLELAAEAVPGVVRAAAVGVGPVGAQTVALVLERDDAPRRPALADAASASTVRAAVAVVTDTHVAAVFVVPALPVDRRHNSKIDRAAVAEWAGAALAGGRIGSLS